jgi:hypothetical protein
MHIVTFAPSLRAVEQEAGGVSTEGFPMTSCYVDGFPARVTIPLVVACYTEGGTDYDPRQYIIATSPRGDRVGFLEFGWHWPDNPGSPVKFRVFAQQLAMAVDSAGVYTIGLYDSPDATTSPHLFPLPVSRLNPLTGRPPIL